MTPRRLALNAVATAGLVGFAGMLLGGNGGSGPVRGPALAPAGSVAMSLFATACATAAALAARGGQRRSWSSVAIGLAGWTIGDAVWCYVALGGNAPISNYSAAELGYVFLPLCALAAAAFVPSRDDTKFGIGLILDGILVAASLLMVLGALLLGDPTHMVGFTRIVLAVTAAIYLGLVVATAIVVPKAEPGRRLSPALMTMAFAVIGITGAIRVYGHGPSWVPDEVVTLGWFGGTYLIALSAIASQPGPDLETRYTEQSSRLAAWLPYIPLSIAIIVGSVNLWPADPRRAFVFSIGLVVVAAALARHLLALDRKQSLLIELSDAVRRDTVTGLANRRLFNERLTHAVQLYVQEGVPVSVLRVRVDDFNIFNDPLGYAAGHELLRNVGERIQANTRGGDTVARMAADEFAILVEDFPEVAARVAERLAKSFDHALDIRDHRVHVSLSIGVASAGSDDSAPLTASDLLDQADAARYRAEQASTTDVRTFTPEMDAHSRERQAFRDGMARMQLLGELRRAIHDSSLTLVYQPKFGMLTGAVCGAEALVRWEHPELGVLAPREFLPLAREYRLMDALTDVVLSRAVADAAGWYEAGTATPVAINLWARSLEEDTLPDRIMSVLDAHGMSASSLTVEITEDLVVADLSKGRAVLNRLRDAGIRVAIDDFGSGYSTLTYLRELPIDDVKLDRQLIAPILYDRRAATITRSVIELAKEFGIASVAEGVENEATAIRLEEFGCDAVQGNFFCRPVPAGEIPLVHATPTLKTH
jgi:diguanylate cyclase